MCWDGSSFPIPEVSRQGSGGYVRCVGPEFSLWRTFRATLNGAVECHWLAPTNELWSLPLTFCSQAAIIYDGRGLPGCLDISPLQWWRFGKLKGHLATAGSGNPRMGGEGWHHASEDTWIMIIPGCLTLCSHSSRSNFWSSFKDIHIKKSEKVYYERVLKIMSQSTVSLSGGGERLLCEGKGDWHPATTHNPIGQLR